MKTKFKILSNYTLLPFKLMREKLSKRYKENDIIEGDIKIFTSRSRQEHKALFAAMLRYFQDNTTEQFLRIMQLDYMSTDLWLELIKSKLKLKSISFPSIPNQYEFHQFIMDAIKVFCMYNGYDFDEVRYNIEIEIKNYKDAKIGKEIII